MPEETKVVRNDGEHRYELWSGDALAGIAQYRERADRTIFTHTEVDPAFSGRGLGKFLVGEVVDDAVRRGRVIVPLCPFVADYLRKHPRDDARVDWPKDTP